MKDIKTISIFDFIEDSMEHAIKNMDSGTIDFYDHAFDEVKIPKIFNLNYFKLVKELRYYNINNLKKDLRKNYFDSFLEYIMMITKGFSYYEEKLEERISKTEHLEILVQRADGIKLNVIGDSINVTKERVRQIEKTAVDNVLAYASAYLESLYAQGTFNNIIFFNFNEIFYFIASENIKKAIIYSLNYYKENNFSIYNKEFSSFINKEKAPVIKRIIKKIKLERYFNYYDNYSKLNNVLIFEENILDFSIDIYLNYLKNNRYLFKGNLAYLYGECSINEIIAMVIRDYYPKGIVLDEKGITQFAKFIENLLNYPFKINSALSKIDENNTELILWGKQTRMHINNIGLNKEQLNILLSEFKKLMENVDYLLFDEAYSKLQYLLKNTQITDKIKLYGVIKYYLSNEYYFKKMAARKLELKNQTLTDLVYEYIDTHDMCTKEEILNDLFVPKATTLALLRENKEIMIINDKYTLFKNIKLENNLKENLLFCINSVTEYVHKDILFENNNELMNKLNIIDSTMLFCLLRYYFNEDYIFNTPYIQNKKYDKPVTIKNILLDIFRKHKNIVSINDITEEAIEITKAKDFSLVYKLRVSEIETFRINKEEITLKENIIFDDIVKYMINNRLNDLFKKENIAFNSDLKELSKGLYFYIKTTKGNKRYPMDLYSLASYLECFPNNYKVFNSAALTSYYDSNYVVCNNKFNSFIEVVYYVLKKNSKDNKLERKQAVKILKSKGLLLSVPTALVIDGYIDIVDDELLFLK